MKEIKLSQGQSALVDDDDFEALNQFNWSANWSSKTKSFYARRQISQPDGKQKTLRMHRVILGVIDPKVEVDHINHDTLDNQRSNLRPATLRENRSNLKGKQTGKYSSRYVGVSWDRNREKWAAKIKVNGRVTNLGRFDSELEAHEAYQKALSSLSR